MPELPEVETIRLGLMRYLPGKIIRSVESDTTKSFPNDPKLIGSKIIGAKITKIDRRAKVLIIELSTSYSLVIHLKMTGQLVYKAADGERWGGGHPNDSLIGKLPDRSTRVTFVFNDGSQLFFNDQRKFGWVKLVKTNEVTQLDFFQRVGPEPLDSEFTFEEFQQRISRRARTSIKAAILDQTVLAGVGNIYADESLHRARIHPATQVRDVSAVKLKRLLNAIRESLQISLDHGGSSDKNYIDADGNRGSYLKFARVFRRDGQACPVCGTTILKIKVAGRGTHYCPKCQPQPRKKL